jgi:hypothetical protein
MPKYIIERVIPASGALTSRSLQKMAQQSCDAIQQIGTKIQWIESFVTADKWYCVYIADEEETIRQHAQIGNFPIDAIHEVMAYVDPVSAEGNLTQRKKQQSPGEPFPDC